MATALSNFALDIVVVGEQDVWADNDQLGPRPSQAHPDPLDRACGTPRTRARFICSDADDDLQRLSPDERTHSNPHSASAPSSTIFRVISAHPRAGPGIREHRLLDARRCSHIHHHLGVANERYVLDIAQ